ncbi:hypothetical protein L218DRAFT_927442 [Marasmius fiardii PR-910]|nr:hypothetical protein L218DRAFT_927442 [Marasmius fiardii PR-910]
MMVSTVNSNLAPSTSNVHVKSTRDATKPKRRFVGSKSKSAANSVPLIRNQIPPEILENADLNEAIRALPPNYNLEIHKTVHHILKNNATNVALQMPEGLQLYACLIADIVERFTPAICTILGDVTYGACCVDDYTAKALGCDMLVHYGHSCLVPTTETSIRTLYIFVEIVIDSDHLHYTIRRNFPSEREIFYDQLLSSEAEERQRHICTGEQIATAAPYLRIEGASGDPDSETRKSTDSTPTRFALVSTIQFVAALQRLKEDLSSPLHDIYNLNGKTLTAKGVALWRGAYAPTIPRSKPLSPGEILGCTAPRLEDVDALIYLGDGRFHLESIMIANPSVPAFRYDPYSKKLTRERYDHELMRQTRAGAIRRARSSIEKTLSMETGTKETRVQSGDEDEKGMWGVVLGTLGRQGSFTQLQAILHQLSLFGPGEHLEVTKDGNTACSCERQSTSVTASHGCSSSSSNCCQSKDHMNTSTTAYRIPFIPILLSELSPSKLSLFPPSIEVFVQTSCPRLSIDWGYAFELPGGTHQTKGRPLLSPYEANLAFSTFIATKNDYYGGGEPRWMRDAANESEGTYPMDFYAAGTPWAISRAKGRFEVV